MASEEEKNMRQQLEDSDETGAKQSAFSVQNSTESLPTVAAFFVFGFVLYSVYSLLIAASEDILKGTDIPTSAVITCIMVPYVLVTLITPYFIQIVPYFPRMVAVVILYETALFCLVFAERVEMRLLAVCIVSFAFGVGEMSCIAMTSFYHQVAVGMFSAGTGVGFIAAPLYYTAMTTWFCVTPETTTLTIVGVVLLYIVFYALMNRKHSAAKSRKSEQPFTDIHYEKLAASEKLENEEPSPFPQTLTRAEKLGAIREILPTLLCVTISWSSEFLVMQAVLTTYAFPNSPFPPRDHYQYYITLFLLGEFIGRSYLAVISIVKFEILPKLMIRVLWVPTVIEVCILVFCLFAAWYRFLPNVAPLLLLSFIAGLVIGIIYANVLQLFTESFEFPIREFVLGYVALATGTGILIAGLLGLVVEPLFRQHCLQLADASGLSEYCFTRAGFDTHSNITFCH